MYAAVRSSQSEASGRRQISLAASVCAAATSAQLDHLETMPPVAWAREQPSPTGPNGEQTGSTRNATRTRARLPQEPQRLKPALSGLTVTVPPSEPSCPGAAATHSIAPAVRLC